MTGELLLARLDAATHDALAACRDDDPVLLARAVDERGVVAAELDEFLAAARRSLTRGDAPAVSDPAFAPIARQLRDAERLGRELEAAVQVRRDAATGALSAAQRGREGLRGYGAGAALPRHKLDRRY